ncbi:hypothetical protein MKX08_001150 [Trichoderma sp. CBMAI-0020]|nr:hypothetical protein MKX08_001150 [Trichoderma sp. CBMAI-0020]
MDNRSGWPTTKDEGIVVGVTAFELYAGTHDFNASNMVLAALPPIITSRKKPAKKVYILKYPEVHVTYRSVSQTVQDIWNPKSPVWSVSAATADIEYDDAEALKVNFSATGDLVEEQFTSCPTILKPDIDVEVVTTEVKTCMPDMIALVVELLKVIFADFAFMDML